MTSRKRRRMWVLLLCGIGLGSATALTLTAFQDNLVFFRSPSDIVADRPGPDRAFRLGGLVEAGSVAHGADGRVRFVVGDGGATTPVVYQGDLPDLFREGQGIVAEGVFRADRTFEASQVLAKHDETYMPREIADRLKERGEWRPETGEAAPLRALQSETP